ncbi:MAG TPA: ECF transporter S component, partial [Prevotella sp.]|nr:ECF transporter S component [Candidatus Segatella violae]
MTESSVRLYQYGYNETKTYLLAVAFVIGNVALPQLFHTIPQGGMIWLPIYFFTLIGAFKYGWRVGLLTAIASPIVNHQLFGMPMAAALPAILTKS